MRKIVFLDADDYFDVSVRGNMVNDKTMKALEQIMRPEFINRVDEIITFRSLTEENFVSIARIMLGELKSALSEKGITLEYSDSAALALARKAYSVKYGARNLRRTIQREVEDALASRLIRDYNAGITKAFIDTGDSGEIIIVCD